MVWIVDNFDYCPNLIFRLPSFPRRRESRFIRAEIVKEKKFPKFYVLDSRLRGNDGSS